MISRKIDACKYSQEREREREREKREAINIIRVRNRISASRFRN